MTADEAVALTVSVTLAAVDLLDRAGAFTFAKLKQALPQSGWTDSEVGAVLTELCLRGVVAPVAPATYAAPPDPTTIQPEGNPT